MVGNLGAFLGGVDLQIHTVAMSCFLGIFEDFFFHIVKYFGVQSGGAIQLPVLKIRVGLKQKIQTCQIAIYLVRENSMYISILAFFFWKYSNSRCVHFSSDL